MLCAILLGTAAIAQSRPSVQALASARIVRSVSASEADWKSPVVPHRRERLVRAKDGQTTLLRIVDYE
jgi:hypothetical protein